MYRNIFRWAGLLLLPTLACTLAQVTPQPAAEVEQLIFEIQTATSTVGAFANVATYTPDPNFTPTPSLTATLVITTTPELTTTLTATDEPEIATIPTIAVEIEPDTPPEEDEPVAEAPTVTPTPVPVQPPAEPIRGGAWDFEEGFVEWANPYGDRCPGSGIAIGWSAFTTQDDYGSSCLNQTVWAANVHSGTSAQELTFAFVGVEAGIFRSTPTIPGHRYTIEAFMRREFSPAKVEVAVGVDLTGGADWQADSVQWFPWNEDLEDEWSRTEVSLTAGSENMTIFIKGHHPFPEPGGTLRLDSISIIDIGPE